MTDRLKAGDRVVVRTGAHKGLTGVIQHRTGSAWVVVLSSGTVAQLPGTSLRRVQ